MRLRRVVGFLAVASVGCRAPEAPRYETWEVSEPAYAPAENSRNAFDGYVIAARMAAKAAPNSLRRASFSYVQRDAAEKALAPALTTLKNASELPSKFEFRNRPLGEDSTEPAAWRLLGRALAWQIGAAGKSGNFDEAIRLAGILSKVGFDLTGGSAADAALGLILADEARIAIMPYFAQLSPAQLRRLSAVMQRSLAAKPPIGQCLGNEERRTLLAVQTVQEALRDNQWDTIQTLMGKDARDPIQRFKELRPRDVPAILAAFGAEAKQEAGYQLRLAAQPAQVRAAAAAFAEARRERRSDPNASEFSAQIKSLEIPAYPRNRVWRRFAQHFFRSGRTLLDMNDLTVARTRLLILTAELARMARLGARLPRSLALFDAKVTVDPFTGRTMIYRTEGKEFAVYSAGSNFQDDGGETDEDFRRPDLRLEGGL